MLIVIYARVSTEEQARSGFSMSEQLRACRSRAAELGTSLPTREFTDQASGELLERPGLQAALDLVRAGEVACLVCLDPDRLARRLMHQLLVTDLIESKGCRLEFVQHDYQETPEGRLFYQLRGAIAEFEKAKILERTSRGQKGKIAAGGLPYQIRMYGYQFIKGAGKHAPARSVLVPDPREADWVRQIYRWCADQGESPAAIAARLNSLGVLTKTGKGAWRSTQVERILRHPAYAAGQLALGKQDHRGLGVARRLSKAQRIAKGLRLSPRPNPQERWSYVAIEPLIPETLWQQAQHRLDRAGHRMTNTGPHPLTGLGRCGLCGGPLYYLSGSRLACANRYGRHWAKAPAPAACTLPAKPREAVEGAAWQQVRRWLLHPPFLQATTASPPDQDEAPTLQAELARREAEAERIGLLFARGHWHEEKALPALAEARRQAEAIRQRLASRKTQLPLPEMFTDLPARAAATIDTLTPDQRTLLLRLTVHHFELLPSPRGAPPQVHVWLHA